MNDAQIARQWMKEVHFCRDNIVINNCIICKGLYRQYWPSDICSDCDRMSRVF